MKSRKSGLYLCIYAIVRAQSVRGTGTVPLCTGTVGDGAMRGWSLKGMELKEDNTMRGHLVEVRYVLYVFIIRT